MRVSLHDVPRPSAKKPKRRVWMIRWFDTAGGRRGKSIGDVGTMTKRQAEAVRSRTQARMTEGIEKTDRPKKVTLADYIEQMNIGYLIEHELGTAKNLRRIAEDPKLELERWIDLTRFYAPYTGDYAKRTYLWKVRARRPGYSDAPD